MEAVDFLTNWIKYLLMIIPVSATGMITYFGLRKSVSTDIEEVANYDNKIKQTFKGSIIALTISGFITLVKSFYN